MDDTVDPLTLNHKVKEIYLIMLFIIKKLNLLKNNISPTTNSLIWFVNGMNNIIMFIIGVQATGHMTSIIYWITKKPYQWVL